MGKTIRAILSLLWRDERRKLFFLLSLDTFVSVLDIVFLALLLVVINFYAQPGNPAWIHALPSWMADRSSLVPIAVFLLFFLLKSIAAYYILQARYRFIYAVASRMAETNLLHYLESDFANYIQVDSSVHSRLIGQQPIEFCHYMLTGMMQMATEGVLIILAIVGIIWFDARLFLLLLVILVPAVVILAYVSKKRLREVRQNVKISSEKSLQYLQETLAGYVESNLYGRNSFFAGRYAVYQREQNQYIAELQIIQGIPSRLIETFAVAGLFILIVLDKLLPGGYHATAFVTLGAFMAAAYKIIPGIVKISNISGQMKTYAFTLESPKGQRPRENETPAKETPDAPRANETRDAVTGDSKSGNDIPVRITSIQFDQVDFSYGAKEVLTQLSLSLKPGDFLGISGASGRGKTTLLHLLLGFLQPDKGHILVNGQPSGQEARKKYWKRIAYVKQASFLLHDTLLNNITLGEKIVDEQKLKEVLEKSGLQEWVGNLPGDSGKLVTEQGKNISGGQRQRIAIARALYKDSDLILLDEPFNELDQKAEGRLLQYFRELAQAGKIIVLITHHRESFSFCTKLIELHGK